jgi:hypothetical protein
MCSCKSAVRQLLKSNESKTDWHSTMQGSDHHFWVIIRTPNSDCRGVSLAIHKHLWCTFFWKWMVMWSGKWFFDAWKKGVKLSGFTTFKNSKDACGNHHAHNQCILHFKETWQARQMNDHISLLPYLSQWEILTPSLRDCIHATKSTHHHMAVNVTRSCLHVWSGSW